MKRIIYYLLIFGFGFASLTLKAEEIEVELHGDKISLSLEGEFYLMDYSDNKVVNRHYIDLNNPMSKYVRFAVTDIYLPGVNAVQFSELVVKDFMPSCAKGFTLDRLVNHTDFVPYSADVTLTSCTKLKESDSSETSLSVFIVTKNTIISITWSARGPTEPLADMEKAMWLLRLAEILPITVNDKELTIDNISFRPMTVKDPVTGQQYIIGGD